MKKVYFIFYGKGLPKGLAHGSCPMKIKKVDRREYIADSFGIYGQNWGYTMVPFKVSPGFKAVSTKRSWY